MKHLFNTACLFVFCLLLNAGCVSVSQTSMKISEAGTIYYFASLSSAKTAYQDEKGESLILKCCVEPYAKKYTFARIAITPSIHGGYKYERLTENEQIYALVKISKIDIERFGECNFSTLGFEICKNIPSNYCEISVPSCIKQYMDFRPSIDGEPPNMHIQMPLVWEEKSSFYPLRQVVAVVDGVVVDFPISVFMTLTGSIWYVPLTWF